MGTGLKNTTHLEPNIFLNQSWGRAGKAGPTVMSMGPGPWGWRRHWTQTEYKTRPLSHSLSRGRGGLTLDTAPGVGG